MKASNSNIQYTIPSSLIEKELSNILALLFSHKASKNVKILILDDDINVCNYIKEILLKVGIESQHITAGKDLYGILPKYQPEILLLDINLPDYSGDSLLKTLRSDIQYQNLPIIIITNEREPKKLEALCSLPINGIILKPLTESNILDAIDRVIKKQEPLVPFKDIVKNLTEQENTSLTNPPMDYVSPDIKIHSKSIIVLDDDREILDFIKGVCNVLGYETICFESGIMGLNFLLQCKDLASCGAIILDRYFPDINGLEILRKVQMKHQTELPVIFLSHSCTEKEVKEGIDAGALDYIAKPFTSRTLKRILLKTRRE